MLVEIPCLPVSVNAAFATDFRTKRRFKTKEYVEFDRLLQWSAKITDRIKIMPTQAIGVEISLTADWRTKKGTFRIVDLANYEKTLVDCLSVLLGFEDSQIFELKMKKCQHTTADPKTEVYIYEIS